MHLSATQPLCAPRQQAMFRRIFDALKGLLNRLVNTLRLENVEARLENVEERLQIGEDLLIGLQADVLKWNQRMEASDETDSKMKDTLHGMMALILLLMKDIRRLKKTFHKDQKSLLDDTVKVLNNADEQFEALRKSVKTLEEKFDGLVHHFDGDIGPPPISREGSVSPSVSPSDIEAANHFLAGLLAPDRDVVGGAAVRASNGAAAGASGGAAAGASGGAAAGASGGAAAGSADRARRWGSAETGVYSDVDSDGAPDRAPETGSENLARAGASVVIEIKDEDVVIEIKDEDVVIEIKDEDVVIEIKDEDVVIEIKDEDENMAPAGARAGARAEVASTRKRRREVDRLHEDINPNRKRIGRSPGGK
jgi:hypothetical protein